MIWCGTTNNKCKWEIKQNKIIEKTVSGDGLVKYEYKQWLQRVLK